MLHRELWALATPVGSSHGCHGGSIGKLWNWIIIALLVLLILLLLENFLADYFAILLLVSYLACWLISIQSLGLPSLRVCHAVVVGWLVRWQVMCPCELLALLVRLPRLKVPGSWLRLLRSPSRWKRRTVVRLRRTSCCTYRKLVFLPLLSRTLIYILHFTLYLSLSI